MTTCLHQYLFIIRICSVQIISNWRVRTEKIMEQICEHFYYYTTVVNFSRMRTDRRLTNGEGDAYFREGCILPGGAYFQSPDGCTDGCNPLDATPRCNPDGCTRQIHPSWMQPRWMHPLDAIQMDAPSLDAHPLSVGRQTRVKTLPLRNFVCGRNYSITGWNACCSAMTRSRSTTKSFRHYLEA